MSGVTKQKSEGKLIIMKKTNKKVNWVLVESLAAEYQKAEGFRLDEIAGDVYEELQGYVKTCVDNYHRDAATSGTHIPKADFESHIVEAMWRSLRDFDVEKGYFQGFLGRRVNFAKLQAWRQYEISDVNSKNGKSYVKAKWDSLDRPIDGDSGTETLLDTIIEFTPSVEDIFVEDHGVFEIINAFAKKNQRYATIIAYIYEGYEGEDLAKCLGEESYSAKIRKTVQRAKESFENFMNQYPTIAAV